MVKRLLCINDGKRGNEEVIGQYIKEQGREVEYVQLHKDQLKLL